MGTIVYTQNAIEPSTQASVSRGGGIQAKVLYARATMGATYATGGDTITVPTLPTGFDLFAVEVMNHNAGAGIDIAWDHSTSTPKLLAYDEDNTSGVAAELANGSAALAAVVVFLRFVFIAGV